MEKDKRQKRFQQKKRHIERQENIFATFVRGYRDWSSPSDTGKDREKSPHRFHKRHALNCGNPNCIMCMNPRKAFGEKTMPERRFECVDTDD